MSYIRKTENLTNRIFVSPTAEGADFTTIEDAVEFAKTFDGHTEIILDGGQHFIYDTIDLYNENGYNINIKGLGSDITFVQSASQCDGKPMFSINENYSSQTTFSRLSVIHYGQNAGNNIFDIKNDSNHEFYDIILQDSDKVFNDESLENGSLFCFNFISDRNNNLYNGSCSGGGSIEFEVGTVNNTPTCFKLVSATTAKEIIINGVYFNGTLGTDKFIDYNAAFTLNNIFNVQNCGGNKIGIFQSGFDFTLSAGTYADVEMIGNSTYEDKKPHFKVNVIDNVSTTTVTTAGTYYKANFTNGSSYTCKMKLENNKYTFLSNHKKDMQVMITGNLQVNNNNRNVNVGLKLNNTGAIISPFTVRCLSSNLPYTFAFLAYLSDLKNPSFFEIFLTSSSNNDVVTIQDLNIFGNEI